ncbi:MAG: cytochrome o ubiquinol oxidase subunit IV [Candidatus Chaera renei]|uniref:Cytochrome o ubiquinol oxidase subunit IV n=1 Tax=Candidatus Chaera renei TaxID=2506947 RepID=A0A4Q0AIK3_9BACT|nr:MAG: cytochrome o ubiquinol oxidase subunit IV [Candidatus Chaera renei]
MKRYAEIRRRSQTKSYLTGYGLSLLLTLAAYWSAMARPARGWLLLLLLAALAVVQLAVQLRFFLHLGKKSSPQWNALVFSFMAIVVFILVAGSLWIMKNLNYNLMNMPPSATEKTIIKDEGISR